MCVTRTHTFESERYNAEIRGNWRTGAFAGDALFPTAGGNADRNLVS